MNWLVLREQKFSVLCSCFELCSSVVIHFRMNYDSTNYYIRAWLIPWSGTCQCLRLYLESNLRFFVRCILYHAAAFIGIVCFYRVFPLKMQFCVCRSTPSHCIAVEVFRCSNLTERGLNVLSVVVRFLYKAV